MSELVPVTVSLPHLVSGRDDADYYLVARETDGERELFIAIGETEATALAFGVQGTEFPRPMTYQFAAALLAASGGGLREVHVTSRVDGVFYARAVLTSGEVVDARPSDAVNLAVITGAPVLVASDLLDLPTRPEPLPAS